MNQIENSTGAVLTYDSEQGQFHIESAKTLFRQRLSDFINNRPSLHHYTLGVYDTMKDADDAIPKFIDAKNLVWCCDSFRFYTEEEFAKRKPARVRLKL